MPFFVDHTRADQSGRDPAQRPRPSLRVTPRLEVLETRCLMSMSGGRPGLPRYDARLLPVPTPAVATNHPIASHHYDRRGVDQAVTRRAGDVGSTPDDGDPSSEYDNGGSGNHAAAWPEIPGLPRARYVIVAESKAPHHTLATAQPLPDLPYFGVVGTLGSGDPSDLYRLTLGAGAGSLNFGLVSDQAVPIQLQLFDGSGQVVGEWSLSGQAGASLHAGLGSLPAGATLYFGIAAGTASGPGGSSGAIDYQLWVNLQPGADRSTTVLAAGTTVSAAAAWAPIGSALPAATGPGALPSRADSQATAAALPNQPGGLLVAVGTPAVRSARPSGGLLSDGDPAPPAASDFHAVVNKEWDERSLTAPRTRERNEVELAAWTGLENEPKALVVLHGPGGFPLLGAVAIGHRRRNPAPGVRDVATAPPLGDWDAQAVAPLAARELPANPDIPATAGDATARAPMRRVRLERGFSASVFSGLGLATVFTLNAILSQPIAGFDYLTSRLDGDGRSESDRKDRPRRSTATRVGSPA